MEVSRHTTADAGAANAGTGVVPAHYTSHCVEAGGLRLNYLDYGRAGRPPLLCVHGGAAHAHWFDFVATGLSADYHVRALDLRGHGDSEWADPPDYTFERFAADLDEVVRKLDLKDFALVGHSMGGMISLVYSATYPGRVARLVIVDTTMHMAEERINAMRERGNRQGAAFATHEEAIARFRLMPAGFTASPEIIRYLGRNGTRQFDDGTWRYKFDRNVYASRKRVNGFPYWTRIKIPALLVKGGLSHRVTPEVVAGVRERCPHVKFAEVANSEHHVTLDNPRGFERVVKAFLAERA